MESLYWNPYLETLDREALRTIQLKKFQNIVAWAFERSPYYREIYREAGLDPRDIKTWGDVSKVPKMDKARLKEGQEGDPFPYGRLLCQPLEEVAEFRQTSGTTGKPVYQADSWADWEWWSESWCHILWSQGYRAADRVFFLSAITCLLHSGRPTTPLKSWGVKWCRGAFWIPLRGSLKYRNFRRRP